MRDAVRRCDAMRRSQTKYPTEVAPRKTLLQPVAQRDMLEAMARIAPSQPNEAMARIASRRNSTISLDPSLPGQNSRERFFERRFKTVLEGSNRFKMWFGKKR